MERDDADRSTSRLRSGGAWRTCAAGAIRHPEAGHEGICRCGSAVQFVTQRILYLGAHGAGVRRLRLSFLVFTSIFIVNFFPFAFRRLAYPARVDVTSLMSSTHNRTDRTDRTRVRLSYPRPTDPNSRPVVSVRLLYIPGSGLASRRSLSPARDATAQPSRNTGTPATRDASARGGRDAQALNRKAQRVTTDAALICWSRLDTRAPIYTRHAPPRDEPNVRASPARGLAPALPRACARRAAGPRGPCPDFRLRTVGFRPQSSAAR